MTTWTHWELPQRHVEQVHGVWREVEPQAVKLDLSTLTPGCTLADVVRIAVACGRRPEIRFEAQL